MEIINKEKAKINSRQGKVGKMNFKYCLRTLFT